MRLATALGLAAMAVSFVSLAQAQPRGHVPDFHGRDFGHFAPHERTVWEGGHWVHDWHDGRFAWWWSVVPFWYLYPEPIYPYPTYVPPAIVVQQAPPVPTGLPPAQFWYYCDKPSGYYPYVASCNDAWREVPVTPPGAPPKKPSTVAGSPIVKGRQRGCGHPDTTRASPYDRFPR